jgi:hypothetical protein
MSAESTPAVEPELLDLREIPRLVTVTLRPYVPVFTGVKSPPYSWAIGSKSGARIFTISPDRQALRCLLTAAAYMLLYNGSSMNFLP